MKCLNVTNTSWEFTSNNLRFVYEHFSCFFSSELKYSIKICIMRIHENRAIVEKLYILTVNFLNTVDRCGQIAMLVLIAD